MSRNQAVGFCFIINLKQESTMKKILFFSALVALLLGATACNDEMNSLDGREVTVQFLANLGDDIDSRAISDGSHANVLQFRVYENGAEIEALRQENIEVVNKHAMVTTQLVKGHTYTFVFWAQNSECGAYRIYNWGPGQDYIYVSYNDDCLVNDENDLLDAFYHLEKDYTVTASFTETITLTRPLAQVNLLTTDIDAVTEEDRANYFVQMTGYDTPIFLELTTGKTYTNNYNRLRENGLTNERIPGFEQYQVLATGYFLAPEEKSMAYIYYSIRYKDPNSTTWGKMSSQYIYNVPIQRNYRTNIIGNFLSKDAKFQIVLSPMYDGDLTVTPTADVPEAIKVAGNKVIMEPNSTATLDLSTLADGVTLDGNGSTLTLSNNTVSANNVTIKNCTINQTASGNVSVLNVTAANCTLQNIAITGKTCKYGIKLTGGNADGEILIEDCEFDKVADYIIEWDGKSLVHLNRCAIDGYFCFHGDNEAGTYCDALVENTTLMGWISWNNGAGKTVTFNNCKFARGSYATQRAVVRPYQTAIFNDCQFASDFEFSPHNESTTYVNNCTFGDFYYFLNGAGFESNGGKGCTIVVDNTTVYKNMGERPWKKQ